jgi:hypothetical protein
MSRLDSSRSGWRDILLRIDPPAIDSSARLLKLLPQKRRPMALTRTVVQKRCPFYTICASLDFFEPARVDATASTKKTAQFASVAITSATYSRSSGRFDIGHLARVALGGQRRSARSAHRAILSRLRRLCGQFRDATHRVRRGGRRWKSYCRTEAPTKKICVCQQVVTLSSRANENEPRRQCT